MPPRIHLTRGHACHSVMLTLPEGIPTLHHTLHSLT